MRAVLGVAIDAGEVCAVLVDADVPALGPFDTQRWAAGERADAEAVRRALAVMTERAARAGVPFARAGLVASEAVVPDPGETAVPVQAVGVDEARLAFLAAAPELEGVRVVALIGRDDAATTASVADIRSGAVLASVAVAEDDFGGIAPALPEAADEAVARAGVAPEALAFLDLRPGDAAVARELSAVLGVPFVTPHGVPWHRATGAALVAAHSDRPPAPAPSPGRRVAVLVSALVALAVLLGGGLAVAIGGAGPSEPPRPADAVRSVPAPQTSLSPETGTPSAVPCPGRDTPAAQAPEARPAGWSVRASDPDLGPHPGPTPPTTTVTAPPCE
ncbi:hypothetical protein [Rhodococcus sp. DMU1]|uniref:hypothetical protein n=1 Tax=Rhodococcus sp. DMU1 TaxID=2722825 RepID=UPI00143E4A61|nr:hypothetical protein [Rhodococcus sp. DMU1]QIX49774.1 hypothetical protein HFP48_09505 [Rhodococcus sp. DMU1]